jgi:phosphomannomutase
MGIQGNIPERDGVLCSLLLLELMAMKKKTLKEILDGIMAELGTFYYKRVDVHTEKNIPAVPDSFLGKKIIKTENLDGIKFNFEDESWILFRKSGTEPLMRIYAEGKSPEEVDKYLAEGQKLIKEID